MATYQFDEIVNRAQSYSTKWVSAPDGGRLPDDIIPLWVADMDFPCALPIRNAIQEAAKQEIFGYTAFPDNYRTTVCDYFQRRHGYRPKEEEMVYTQGVVPALRLLVRALTEPGDEVIIQTPVYYPFFSTIRDQGRILVENPLLNDNGSYTMDYENLEELAARPQTKMIILCSPHNPVGRVWTEEELKKVYEICTRHGLFIACDEIHCDLIRKGYTFTSMKKMYPDADNLAVCTAPSKTFNIAGLGASHMFIHGEQERERVLQECGFIGANPMTAAGVIAALTQCDDWLDAVNDYTDANFQWFYEEMAKSFPKAIVTRTEGTYLAWMDILPYTEDSKSVETQLLKDCHVYLECGDAFDGKGFLRINLASPLPLLKEAAKRACEYYKDKI